MLIRNEQILLLLIFFIAVYFTYKINNLEKKNIEKFTITNDTNTQNNIKTSIKNIYLADVEAIRILSDFAINLMQNNVIIPGNITIDGQVNISNINSLNNISISGNINANGGISGINNIITNKNININGITQLMNDITVNKNISISGSINVLDNISANKNMTIDGITTIMNNLNTQTIIVGSNSNTSIDRYTTGIIKCNEIICNKMGGGAVVGAWLINKSTGAFPIYSSITNYTNYGISGIDDTYIVMPGYSLIVYSDVDFTTPITSMNNINNITAQIYNFIDIYVNKGKSCQLYYMQTTTPYAYISPISVTISTDTTK